MITATRIRSVIRNVFPEIVRNARTRATCYVPMKPKLLGSSRKVEKGSALGVRSAVLYLSPATESGRNVCPHATCGCAAACLGHNSGQLALTHAARSRAWKTALFFGARRLFIDLLTCEIEALQKRATRERVIPAVRLDGSSDVGLGARLAPAFPNVRFWDYTKNVERALRAARGLYAPNYHVTFSRSGENDDDVSRVLEAGGAVAVVFNARPGRKDRAADPLPSYFTDVNGRRWRVIDGDESDARFLDRRAFGIPEGTGYVVGLRFKAARDRAGHVARAGAFVVGVK